MTSWEDCPAVERDPERVSGAWVFRGTRVPVAALIENLKDGATVDEFLTWFPGVDRSQIEAVLGHEAASGARNSRPIAPDEAWKITCHEAGHAIFAVRHGIIFESVKRGTGEHGIVKLCANPIDNPEEQWSPRELQVWQEFYAAGAAAERLLFDTDRYYALRSDISNHAVLERRLNRERASGFEEDVQSATRQLDSCSIEVVARELQSKTDMTFEEVAAVIGGSVPW